MNVGDVIGEYRLSFRLGEGPRGVVWRASRVDRMQNAILKLIKPNAFDMGRPIQKAFERLTQTLSKHGRFDHPNLAAVVGTARRPEDGLFGLGSEYLEARNLDVFPFRSIDARTIVDDASAFTNLLGVMEQLGSVVMWLHMSGTLHGDIKPSNVLVVPTDRGLQVKLTDLVWARAGLGGFTEYQKAYTPPESAGGEQPTPASDQWAVAKILHQLIVKGSPGRSQTEALSALPVDLLKALQRALDSNPANRFPTMAPLVEAMRQIRTQKQDAGDPIRMRAHQIGYSPTTPVSVNDVGRALESVRSRDVTDKEINFGAISPARDVRAPVQPLRPSTAKSPEPTYIAPVHDDDDFTPPKSNVLSWIAIVIASAVIAIAGGYLVFGIAGDETPAISATPEPPVVQPPPPPPAKMIDEPVQPIEEGAAPPPPAPPPPKRSVEPAAGEKGVEIAKRCKAGKSAACVEAGEMFAKAGSQTEALALFDRACQLKSMNGCLRAADILVALDDGKKARRYYEKSCDSALAAACSKLAELWREGIGGTKNQRTADSFDDRACKLGRKSSCK